MANLIISDALAHRLNQLAEERHSRVEDVITLAIDGLPTSPAVDQTEPDFDASFRAKIYAMARQYWERVGNTERLALSDTDLDEQFWLIDHEGVPRLKSEEGTITLPHDPLEDMIGLIDQAPANLSESVRETMASIYQAKYDRARSD